MTIQGSEPALPNAAWPNLAAGHRNPSSPDRPGQSADPSLETDGAWGAEALSVKGVGRRSEYSM